MHPGASILHCDRDAQVRTSGSTPNNERPTRATGPCLQVPYPCRGPLPSSPRYALACGILRRKAVGWQCPVHGHCIQDTQTLGNLRIPPGHVYEYHAQAGSLPSPPRRDIARGILRRKAVWWRHPVQGHYIQYKTAKNNSPGPPLTSLNSSRTQTYRHLLASHLQRTTRKGNVPPVSVPRPNGLNSRSY